MIYYFGFDELGLMTSQMIGSGAITKCCKLGRGFVIILGTVSGFIMLILINLSITCSNITQFPFLKDMVISIMILSSYQMKNYLFL